MSKTLKQAKVGETVTVQRLQGEGPVKRRIMDMGITKGASIFVRKVAPLGDPIEVTVRGYELSLRKDDAELKAAFDKALGEMRKDGTYDKMAKKYFDFNVYGD